METSSEDASDLVLPVKAKCQSEKRSCGSPGPSLLLPGARTPPVSGIALGSALAGDAGNR